jgi:hypothetical protein
MNTIKCLYISIFTLILSSLSLESAMGAHVIAEPSVLMIDGTSAPYKNLAPGDTVLLKGGARPYLLIRNFTGSFQKPIVFINYIGQVMINTDWHYGIVFRNCMYFKLTGTGDPANFYGIMITRVQNGAGLSIGELSSYAEIDHVYIDNVSQSGIFAKTDPDCSFESTRDKFTMYNTIIHDCFVGHTGDEGFYVGSSFYGGKTITCNGKDTLVYPHLMHGVRIYNNIVMYTGWDGIQVGSASTNCQIFNNLVMYDSQDETNYQMSGILIGGGSQCDCYNNYIYKGKGDGIESLGLGDYRIFNNIIVDAGRSYHSGDPSKMKYGIYVNDNSAKPNSSFSIVFNDIINPKSNGIRFSSAVTRNNLIASNAIINPGLGSNAYIVITNPACQVTVKNNYLALNANNAGFLDSLYRLGPTSPLINNGHSDPRRVYFDYFYRPRPVGTKFDIGTYEFNGTTPGKPSSEEEEDILPMPDGVSHFSVQPITFPNPVQKILTITYTIDNSSDVELIIYDMQGSGFYHEDQKQQTAGEHFFKVNTEFFPEGVCLFSIRANGQTYTGKFYKVK